MTIWACVARVLAVANLRASYFVILYKPMFINCSSIMGGSSARLVDVGTQLCGTHRAVRIVNKKKNLLMEDPARHQRQQVSIRKSEVFYLPIYSFELQFYFLPFAASHL